jgi:hypothetical protein
VERGLTSGKPERPVLSMPKTTRRLTVHPLTLREVEVVRVVDLTQGMRRITPSGAQLGESTSANGFPQPAFDSSGFDDIRLVFRHPGRAEPVLPVRQEKCVDLPRNPRPLSKVRTVRRRGSEALRRHLVEARALSKEDIGFAGYRRRGEVVVLETDEAVPDPEKSETPFEKLHELIRPVAIRTAVEPGHFGLTAVGEVLTNEFVADTLHPAGLVRTTTHTVGWGTAVHELVPAETH